MKKGRGKWILAMLLVAACVAAGLPLVVNDSETHTLEKAGHCSQYECPHCVADPLLAFLKDTEGNTAAPTKTFFLFGQNLG